MTDAHSVDNPPPRRFDMRYINVLASLLAVFVSLLSLWLAWSANRTQERMLAASSWPYLRLSSGNLSDSGEPVIRFTISNGGSGPAILHWLRLSSEGRPLANADALLKWSSPQASGLTTWTSATTAVAMPPGDEIAFLQFHRTEGNAEAWEQLNQARFRLQLEGCYCSIIGDCWMFTGTEAPTPASTCPAPPRDAWQG